jgi:hypothetical protein
VRFALFFFPLCFFCVCVCVHLWLAFRVRNDQLWGKSGKEQKS